MEYAFPEDTHLPQWRPLTDEESAQAEQVLGWGPARYDVRADYRDLAVEVLG